MSDPVLDTIIDYIETEQKTNHAILINGEWGTGKTHYWDSVIKKELKKTNNDKKTIRYLSLFGLNNEEQLKASIFLEFMEENKKWSKLSGEVSKGILVAGMRYFRITNKEIKFNPQNFIDIDNTILCIDDFERTTLSPVAILGILDQILEKHNIKIIVLANECDIKEKHKEDYYVYKEKVIAKTIGFTQSSKDVLTRFIGDYNINQSDQIMKMFYEDLLKMNDDLVNYLEKTNNFNYRILGQSLSDAYSLYRNMTKESLIAIEFLRRENIIASIVELSFAQKTGNYNFNNHYKINPSTYSVNISSAFENKDKKIAIGSNKYFDYKGSNFNIYQMPQMVFLLIVQGKLDVEKMGQEIQNWLSKDSGSDKLMEKVDNILLERDDQKIIEIASKVITYVGQGKFMPKDFVNAFQFIKSLSLLGLCPKKELSDDISVYFYFKSSLDKMSLDIVEEDNMMLSLKKTEYDPLTNQLIDEIIKVKQTKKEKYSSNRKIKILEEMKEDPHEMMGIFSSSLKKTEFQDNMKEITNTMYNHYEAYTIGLLLSKVISGIRDIKISEPNSEIEWFRLFYTELKYLFDQDDKQSNFGKLIQIQFGLEAIKKLLDDIDYHKKVKDF